MKTKAETGRRRWKVGADVTWDAWGLGVGVGRIGSTAHGIAAMVVLGPFTFGIESWRQR